VAHPELLDSYELLLANRAHAARPSEVRKVFAAASRPGVISFAGGAPFLDALPFEKIARDTGRIIAEQGVQALQYGSSQGVESLRQHIVRIMALEGIKADPTEVLVSTGSQQALDVAARMLVNPGDVILAEGPSYAGGMAVFTSYEAQIVHVPGDSDGIIPGELERLVEVLRGQGKVIKGLYTIPNFQNPGGTCLSVERRTQIGELCRREGLLIFEDNPYGLLGFEGQTLPAIQPQFPEITMYFGSFSKIIAPGLRLGWVLAPEPLRGYFTNASETAQLNPSVFSQLVMSAYLDDPEWERILDEYRGMYRERCQAMSDSLAEYMPPGVRWNTPTGGFYLWVTLPEGLDSTLLVQQSINKGVVYVPGTAFFTDGRGANAMRLSFCGPNPEQIREGIRILAQVVRRARS